MCTQLPPKFHNRVERRDSDPGSHLSSVILLNFFFSFLFQHQLFFFAFVLLLRPQSHFLLPSTGVFVHRRPRFLHHFRHLFFLVHDHVKRPYRAVLDFSFCSMLTAFMAATPALHRPFRVRPETKTMRVRRHVDTNGTQGVVLFQPTQRHHPFVFPLSTNRVLSFLFVSFPSFPFSSFLVRQFCLFELPRLLVRAVPRHQRHAGRGRANGNARRDSFSPSRKTFHSFWLVGVTVDREIFSCEGRKEMSKEDRRETQGKKKKPT